jgi:membrane-associated phospholipid phosphatase
MVLLLCAGIFSFYLPRAYAAGAWLLTLVFSAPRLMGGGHWLTDVVVGATAVAGFVLSWTLATPLHSVTKDALERFFGRIRRRRESRSAAENRS